MKALVTGATGFIGSELIKTLEKKGYSLRILSRKSYSGYDTVICNLGIDLIPDSALDSVEVVFHLAGYTHDIESNPTKDVRYHEVNVKATIDLIKVASKNKVRKFIFISSVKAGGIINHKVCMNEDNQGDPQDIYGKTKREAEVAVLKMGKDYGVHVSIIRPALVYGEKMKGNLAIMFNSIKSGWFPPLPETYNKRSMISVTDLVSAIVLITEDIRTKGKIYIATDGRQYSSRDIYKAICLATGNKIPGWVVPKTIFYILATIGDIFKFIPFNSYKYHKLFGSEYYSSEKLHNLGFSPEYNFYSYLKKYSTHKSR